MNPIAMSLGNINIYWYSVILFIAFFIGSIIATKEAIKHQIKKDFLYDMFFYLVPICLVGARIYFVIFNWEYYSSNLIEIIEVWNGGLAIHGGIIFGGLFILYYTKKNKVDTLKIFDILVVSLIIGQAIGRWGNFFNGEAHGPLTTLTYLQEHHIPRFIINGMSINGSYYIPTFLYESIWCIVGFVILFLLRENKKIRLGQITCVYFVWYGLGRLYIESLRTDSLMLGNIKIAQVISLGMIIIGIMFFIKFNRNSKYN